MAKVCEMCGKGPSTGNNVSHSVRRTKRRFLPNLIRKKIFDPVCKMMIRKKICTGCLRTQIKKAASAKA